jgi:hypothetical protein
MKVKVSYWIYSPQVSCWVQEYVPTELLDNLYDLKEIKPSYLQYKGLQSEYVKGFSIETEDDDENQG